MRPNWRSWGVLLVLVTAASCGPQASPTPAPAELPAGTLAAYQTPTASQTPTPLTALSSTPIPQPSPTPRSHVIARGEDLGGIAYRYGVSVAAIVEANPGVDPRLLVVGASLVIPPSAQGEVLEDGILPSPTPVALRAGRVNCLRSAEGGAWCFAMLRNPGDQAVEGVAARMTVQAGEGGEVRSQSAELPLNRLPAGGRLPLAAYFPPPWEVDGVVSVSVQSALPVGDGGGRYSEVRLANESVTISPDGLSAQVEGELEVGEGGANTLWVALAALDANGRVVGVRRWENKTALTGGGKTAFQGVVYSLGQRIHRVIWEVEARP